jgi:hypothetical protein
MGHKPWSGKSFAGNVEDKQVSCRKKSGKKKISERKKGVSSSSDYRSYNSLAFPSSVVGFPAVPDFCKKTGSPGPVQPFEPEKIRSF